MNIRGNKRDWKKTLPRKHSDSTPDIINVLIKEPHVLTEEEKQRAALIREGKKYVQLMEKVSEESGLPVDQIQFNFSFSAEARLSSDKKEIKLAISAYVKDQVKQINEKKEIGPVEKEAIIKKLNLYNKIDLPYNAAQINSYQQSLRLRGESFCNAAKRIINASTVEGMNNNKDSARVDALLNQFKNYTEHNSTNENNQAYYQALTDSLKQILSLYFEKEKKGKEDSNHFLSLYNYLKNAETLENIRDKKAHITLSGNPKWNNTGEIESGVVRLQIEQPLTKFKHLSTSQQNEWTQAIKAYRQGKKGPDWFERLPGYEKKYWEERLLLSSVNPETEVDGRPFKDLSKKEQNEWQEARTAYLNDNEENLPIWFKELPKHKKDKLVFNSEADVGPVVMKSGVPGLRNLALSSFVRLKYTNNHLIKTFKSGKSVRSSNLVVQYQEKTKDLSKIESKLTAYNINQVDAIYRDAKNKMDEEFMNLWREADKYRPKFKLHQTLLRTIGGGDEYVIDNKKQAIQNADVEKAEKNDVEKRLANIKTYDSNHCIGAVNEMVYAAMHYVTRANTKTLEHITTPVSHFLKDVVQPTLLKWELCKFKISENNSKIPGKIDSLYKQAEKGTLTNEEINNVIEKSVQLKPYPDREQLNSVRSVLLALNMYAQINDKKTAYKKHYQLHQAALEEIIYMKTGNCVQSSCKSGKDREGIEKNYRNAMLDFLDEHGYLPPAKADKLNPYSQRSKDRREFLTYFIQLLVTHHQARLAELNADGCQGQKALNNVIPKDIVKELKEMDGGKQLLELHKQNAAINYLDASNVKANPETYNAATESYLQIIKDESEGVHEAPHHNLE